MDTVTVSVSVTKCPGSVSYIEVFYHSLQLHTEDFVIQTFLNTQGIVAPITVVFVFLVVILIIVLWSSLLSWSTVSSTTVGVTVIIIIMAVIITITIIVGVFVVIVYRKYLSE